MDVFALICFITLAKTGSFSKSAEELYLSQSAFSKWIISLEKDLGARLINRSTRKVTLTPAGEAIIPYARNLVSEYLKTKETVNEYISIKDKRLFLFTHSFLTAYDLSSLIFNFSRDYPEYNMELQEVDSRKAAEYVKNTRNSIGIVFLESNDSSPYFDCHPLIYDPLVVLVGSHHRFSSRSNLNIKELAHEKFQIMQYDLEPFLYDYIMKQCRKAGFKPKVNSYSLWISTIFEILRNQDVVSIVPEKIASKNCPSDIKILPLSDVDPLSIQLIRSSGSNPADNIQKTFISYILSGISTLQSR